jgi:hypothetical protein
MAKKRKKRQKKTYNLKELQEKWKLQRFDEKKYYDRMRTILAIIGAVVLVSFAILSCFVVGIYKPIDKEDAITCSKEFQDFHSYFSKNSGYDYSIELSNNELRSIPDEYFNGKLENDLRRLSPGTILDFKMHPDGTILEIKVGQKEILNFDYAQKQLLKRSIFIFVLGILCFLGMVACTVYAMIKIIRYKVFAPSKNIYKRR